MNNKKKILGSLALATLVVATVGALNVKDTEYANADVAVNPKAFEMVEGASIRLAADKNGIRFKTKIGSEVHNSIMTRDPGKDVRVGAFIVPAAYVDDQDAYKDGAEIGDYDQFRQFKEVVFYDSTNAEIENKIYQDGDYYYTNAVLTNVKYENLGKEFVGIGYLQWTTEGISTYEFVDLDATDVVRSAAYVASAHYKNETDSTRLEYVKQYAYGALFEKTGVVTFDEATKKYTAYGAEDYTKVDDVMTAIGGKLELVVDNAEVEADVNGTIGVVPTLQLTYKEEKGGATENTVSGITFAIDCTSNNSAVVKVEEDGTIKAVSGGEATLTYTCMDKTATCDVTVIQRQKATLSVADLDLSKDSAAVINVAEGEIASKVYLGEMDITNYVTATAGTVSIAKEVFTTKGDNRLTILTQHYEYDAYVCVADYVLSDYNELLTFRSEARKVSDQLDAITSATSCDMLTYSDTWDWYVVLDADITCTGSISQLASYFGVFDGRGHKITNLTIEESTKWQYNGFFDNRIANGETGVTDSKGVMHEGIGLRAKNLALINMGSSTTRCGFTTTATKGATYSNMYIEASIGLVSMCKYMLDGANVPVGSFTNLVVGSYTPTYFPWPSGDNYNYQVQNIGDASRVHVNKAMPVLRGWENVGYATVTEFYNGVKTAITGSDTWNKHIWKVDASGNITFGGNVIIEAPAA